MIPIVLFAVASEVASWLDRSRTTRRLALVLSVLVIALALREVPRTLEREPFRRLAFENYTDSEVLRNAFAWVRRSIEPDAPLAFQGKCDLISPALVTWELGPALGRERLPVVVSHRKLWKIDEASDVLLLVPTDWERATDEVTVVYEQHRDAVEERVARGEFVFAGEFALPEHHLAFRLYRKRPAALAGVSAGLYSVR